MSSIYDAADEWSDSKIYNKNDYVKDVIETFNETAIKVCEGQQLDMDFENKTEVSISDYLKMIEYKTAVLLGASLKIGAIIGKAKNIETKHLYDFGKNIGIAFQLQDDLLDTYGNSDTFGKTHSVSLLVQIPYPILAQNMVSPPFTVGGRFSW